MASRSRPQEGRARRGFAAMDPEERREISRRGGEASHQSGRGHEFNSEEAREAGRRGGEARWGRSREEEEEEERGGRPAPRSRSIGSSRDEPEEERPGRSRRGFTTIDPEEGREIARRGGGSRWAREEEEDDDAGASSASRSRPSREENVDEEERGEPIEPDSRREEAGRSGRQISSEERREIGRRGIESRWSRHEEDDEVRGRLRSRRGFASMDPEEQREIARRGGEASGRTRGGRNRND